MAVRTFDPRQPEVYPPGRCAHGCKGGLAQVYCRGCNLTYCLGCAHPHAHGCRGVDEVNARRGPDGDAWLARAGYVLRPVPPKDKQERALRREGLVVRRLAWVWPHKNGNGR